MKTNDFVFGTAYTAQDKFKIEKLIERLNRAETELAEANEHARREYGNNLTDLFRQMRELKKDKERLDWLDKYMTEYLMIEVFGYDVKVDTSVRDAIDAARRGKE